MLVPRPETELLVQRALDLVVAPEAGVADLGTGSGAIAISLATERPGWRVFGTDASPTRRSRWRAATASGSPGVVSNGRHGDWFSALGDRRFDALVSNPPVRRRG